MSRKQLDAFPEAPRIARVTFTLPVATAEAIERLADRMKVSRSSFVAELLAEPIQAMAAIIDLIPETGATQHDVRRARGQSIDFIRTVVGQALELLATEAKGPAASMHAPEARRPRRATRKAPQKAVRKPKHGRKG